MKEKDSGENAEKKKIVIKDLKPRKDPKAGQGGSGGSSPPPPGSGSPDPYSYP